MTQLKTYTVLVYSITSKKKTKKNMGLELGSGGAPLECRCLYSARAQVLPNHPAAAPGEPVVMDNPSAPRVGTHLRAAEALRKH